MKTMTVNDFEAVQEFLDNDRHHPGHTWVKFIGPDPIGREDGQRIVTEIFVPEGASFWPRQHQEPEIYCGGDRTLHVAGERPLLVTFANDSEPSFILTMRQVNWCVRIMSRQIPILKGVGLYGAKSGVGPLEAWALMPTVEVKHVLEALLSPHLGWQAVVNDYSYSDVDS